MKKEQDRFYEVVRVRRSVRRFSSRPVEREKLARLMEVGRNAASADNRQPWKFFLLHREGREEFDGHIREHFRKAPVIILACARPEQAWKRRFDGRGYAWLDVGIALTEMILAATAEGLGSCWVASFDPEGVRAALGLEGDLEPVAAVALGYPEAPLTPQKKTRKPLGEVWEER